MKTWRREIIPTAWGNKLGGVNIKIAIFQEDRLSTLLLAVCILPLTNVLREMSVDYMLGSIKANNL